MKKKRKLLLIIILVIILLLAIILILYSRTITGNAIAVNSPINLIKKILEFIFNRNLS